VNYYNENDPKAAAWLRELIKENLIASGEVDERSIEDVCSNDLRGYVQCHFFAGIGGWSAALRLAGWPDDKPVWTGSCPCQPFSAAGKRAGTSDERHLWPAWQWLIRQCEPHTVFGEQVASKDGIAWLDLVSNDMEGENYAIAPIVLPACSVGAFHKRERLWFVANADGRNAGKEREQRGGEYRQFAKDSSFSNVAHTSSVRYDGGGISEYSHENENQKIRTAEINPASGHGADCDVANAASDRWLEWRPESIWGSVEWHRGKDGKLRPIKPGVFPLAHGISGRVGLLRGYGNAIVPQVAAEVIMAYMEATA
jgi:DNA (cytosine-5)-methyltransferase 1